MQIVHFSQQMQAGPFSGGFHAAVVRILITGIAVFLAVATVPGLEANSFGSGLAAVLVLTILNLVITSYSIHYTKLYDASKITSSILFG